MAFLRTASVLVTWLIAFPGGAFLGSNVSFGAQVEGGTKNAVKVFILAGQSNMSGRAAASDLPPRFRVPPPRVQIDYVCSFGASDLLKPEDYLKDGGTPEPHRSKGWVPLQPAPKHLSTPG